MSLRKALGVLSFCGALGIGAGAAYLVNGSAEPVARGVHVSYRLAPLRESVTVPRGAARVVAVASRDLVGTWTGTWGYGGERCTIEIHRASGTTFEGTLRKEGTVVSLEGYIDPETRRVSFKETEVLKTGSGRGRWSLGINTGTFSADARTLSGSGTDEWGTYQWETSKGR